MRRHLAVAYQLDNTRQPLVGNGKGVRQLPHVVSIPPLTQHQIAK